MTLRLPMFNDMTYCVIVWPNVPYTKLSFCSLIVDWLMTYGMEPMHGDRGSGLSLSHTTCFPPWLKYFHIEHWSYFILSYLVFDIECSTPGYVITMSWPNVPCAKLPQ